MGHDRQRRVATGLLSEGPEGPSRGLRAALVGAAVLLVAGALAISAPERAAVVSAGATTTAARVAPAVTIRQFPVQGACWFMDTFGAPRSGGRSHEGVDIIAKSGLYLYAVDAGTLTKQYLDAPGTLAGNGWRLTRADGTYFFYAHLSAFAPGLKVGSKVVAGQILGNVGMTGNAGTPHLHFEVHPGGGAAINPTPTVKAVDGCKITAVPPQPGAPTVTTVPSVTSPVVTSPAATVAPTTSVATPPVTSPVVTAPSAAGLWSFIAPIRAFDTAGNKLAPGATKRVKVASLTGVPAGTPGVMVRLAVRNIADNGYVTVFPCDVAPPLTSSLNYSPGILSATMTMVRVVGGEICLTASSAVDLRMDVVGVLASQGVGVRPIVVKRGLDTRTKGPVLANTTRAASLSSLGVPTGTKAVTLTVMVLSPAAAGSIGIGPCGGTPWILPYTSAQAQVFSGIIRSNDAGICVTTTSTTHVVLDATAAWIGSSKLLPVPPSRLFDSRRSSAVTPTGTTVKLSLPAGMTQAQLTVTVIGRASGTPVLAWNCAVTRPVPSVVYASTGKISSASITMTVTGGSLCLAALSTGHVVVDLTAIG